MRPINRYLLDNNIRISHNPCISPDFCLDWPALAARLTAASVKERPNSPVRDGSRALDAPRRRDDMRLRVEAGAARKGCGSCRARRWRDAGRWLRRIPCHVGKPASAEERRAGARSRLDDLSDGRRQTRAQHAGNRRALHHTALARGRVGDARAQSRRDRQSEQHSARAGLRRRRHARRPARYGAVSVHRHERARRASGPKRRGHEPRLRAVEAQDRISPAAHCVELQRRSSADWRQVRRAGRCVGARLRARQLHHVRLVARARADAPAGRRGVLGEGARAVRSDRPRSIARGIRRPHPRRHGIFEAARLRVAGARKDEAPRREVPCRARKSLHDRGRDGATSASCPSTSCPG